MAKLKTLLIFIEHVEIRSPPSSWEMLAETGSSSTLQTAQGSTVSSSEEGSGMGG